MNLDNNSRGEKDKSSMDTAQKSQSSGHERHEAGGKNDNCCDLPNINVIKGLVAIFLGTLFVLIAHKIIVHALLLGAGFGLIYYGLVTLNITQINDAIRWITAKTREFFRKLMK